jgi:type VI protein secretion system component Hcp
LINRPSDQYSEPLMVEGLSGGGESTAVIYFTSPSVKGQLLSYLEFDLSNVVVSSYHIKASGQDNPTEDLTLNFTEIKVIAHFPGGPSQTFDFQVGAGIVGGP